MRSSQDGLVGLIPHESENEKVVGAAVGIQVAQSHGHERELIVQHKSADQKL